MRDVAAAADVALGTVYRYFSSKERLLLEAMVEQQDDLRALPRGAPAAPSATRRRAASCSVLRRREPVAARAIPTSPRRWCASFGAAQIENADIVQRVTEIMTAIITGAIHAPERRAATDREVRVARILMQVWLSSLNGWVCGVDGPDRVDEDLAAAADLLLVTLTLRRRQFAARSGTCSTFGPMPTRHYNFADLFELAVDKVPDRLALVDAPPRGHLPRARRAREPARAHARRRAA